MEKPSKENSLYLPIKQVYFDQIIAGTKTEEYRDILQTTYKKYLACDEEGNIYYNEEILTDEDMDWYDEEWFMACKDGKFPYYFRKDIKFLNLAVGYNKNRDTAIVEVKSITPRIHPDAEGKDYRFDFDGEGRQVMDPNGPFCLWQAVFHLGKVVEKNIVSK